MKRVLLTGAAGGVSTWLRKLLPAVYPGLVLSDLREPGDLGPGETFIRADLSKPDEIERACEGIEGIIHLGGQSKEAPWEAILEANIAGCYNLFEAARKSGTKRVVFATSNHAVGFYPRSTTIGGDVIPRPDSRYGVSKLFGEGLGAMYAYKHGIGVTSLRIGNVGDRPLDERRLAIWLKPEDLVQLIRIGLERPGLVYEVLYGVSDNRRAWYDNSRAEALGYKPEGRSENFAAEVLEAEPKSGKHPVAEHYQGGTFCADEYSADFAELKHRS
jgi:uronate dehydrogenase